MSYLRSLSTEAALQSLGLVYASSSIPAIATLSNGDNTLGQKIGGTIGALAPMLSPKTLGNNMLLRLGIPITTSLIGRSIGGIIDPQRK